MTADSWDDAERFFAEFVEDGDRRGQKASINLSLVRSVRPRWESALECFHVLGDNVVFSPRGAPYTSWVRIDSFPETEPPTVSICLVSRQPGPTGRYLGLHGTVRGEPVWGAIIGGDVCLVPSADVVLEGHLLQIAQPGTA